MTYAGAIDNAQRDADRAVKTGIGLLLLSTTACVVVALTGKAEMLHALVPVLSVAVGAWFLIFSPAYYVSFVMALWLFIPFLRRILDYKVGQYSEDPFMMTAPFLVSGLAILSLIRHREALRHKVFVPFIAVLVAITFGLIVSIGLGSPVEAAKSYLAWAGPVMMGMLTIIHWKEYPTFRRVILSTITYALILTGTYALVQYVVFPPWDKLWFIGAEMSSIGKPEPMSVRVWSTLNSPGPYAMTTLAAVLVQLGRGNLVSTSASFLGVLGLMLSNVRASWLGLVVGLLFAISRADGQLQKRLIVTVGLIVVVGVPLALKSPLADPISDRFSDRVETLGSVNEDGSFQARSSLYADAPGMIMKAPLGKGLGTVSYDSGWITIFIQLGWFGGIVYVVGLLMVFFSALGLRRDTLDHFSTFALTSTLVSMLLMFAGSQQGGAMGTFMWTFFGMVHASSYYNGQAVQRDTR